ncbi:MAG: HlyD family efflux transporter periplasmic adaptor subunit [Chitinophagales bacterium]|nr:HlyD family efflux transporter periplasmic adaptor subunit [Chitinophagales bacterium]
MERYHRKLQLQSFSNIYRYNVESKVKTWFISIGIFLIVFLFLPWTQNIKSKGQVTTLKQEDRPQEINSPISGKITKWWVKEGDFVRKGDTILQISEIKAEYLDPELIIRTQEQVGAKENAIDNYESKINTTKSQIQALKLSRDYKIEQVKNKIAQLKNKLLGEKAEQIAIINEYELSNDQYQRQLKMYEDGLVSKTQLQQRNIQFQNTQAKKIAIENKIAQTNQEIINTQIELNAVEQDYIEKSNKVEGELYQSQSQLEGGKGDLAKLKNQVSNYIIRNGMYFILAPQDGQVIQANKSGIGEIAKEGENIANIIPTKVKYAVEIFVRPVDLPLINIGQNVRFIFDGFPAIVFSGWPENSYGTFGGKIIAYESNISKNGLFRVLVVEDSTQKKWPPQLKIGSGAQSIALIKDVPIWYELWRNINGFPPDYYVHEEPQSKNKK